MPSITIDCFPESAKKYGRGYAVIAVDVIRATTTIVTSILHGHRCFPVASVEDALRLATTLPDAILLGEQGGEIPEHFHLNNSPATLSHLQNTKPVVLLSTSGTKLVAGAPQADRVYVACLSNAAATARYVAGRHDRIAVIGAGSKGEFREEDEMCCAWIAAILLEHGYVADDHTLDAVRRWADKEPEAFLRSNSVAFLRRTNQLHDLRYVLAHVNDNDLVVVFECGECVAVHRSAIHASPPVLNASVSAVAR